jgi:hypothetical protein
MGEFLTRAEIEARFPGEWVLLDDLDTDQYLHVQGGKVVYHGKDRDDVYRQVETLLPPPRRFTVLYTGPMPERIAINL